MNRLFKLQKRALRTIYNNSYLEPSMPLFKKYNFLNVFDMYQKEVAIFMYKYKNSKLSKSFDGIFTSHTLNHNYHTRNKDDYMIPIHKLNNNFTVGPKVWNQLPKSVKPANSLFNFKIKLSSLLGYS